MTITQKTFAAIGAILFIAGFSLIAFQSRLVEGSAPSGQSSYLQSATTTATGPQQIKKIFSATTNCKARVISTRETALMVVFGATTTLNAGDIGTSSVSATIGHVQAASTTVAYDGGIYGCGEWWAFGFSSTTITTSSF